jgi:hypothetical protein
MVVGLIVSVVVGVLVSLSGVLLEAFRLVANTAGQAIQWFANASGREKAFSLIAVGIVVGGIWISLFPGGGEWAAKTAEKLTEVVPAVPEVMKTEVLGPISLRWIIGFSLGAVAMHLFYLSIEEAMERLGLERWV